MEGGLHKAESTEFRDLLYLTSKQPFILRLAFSAGIGGLLFGYDTGHSNSQVVCQQLTSFAETTRSACLLSLLDYVWLSF